MFLVRRMLLTSVCTWIYRNEIVACKGGFGLLNLRKACPGIWQNLTHRTSNGFYSRIITHCLLLKDFYGSYPFAYSLCVRTWVKYNTFNKLLMATDRKWQETGSLAKAFPWLLVSQNIFAETWPRNPRVWYIQSKFGAAAEGKINPKKWAWWFIQRALTRRHNNCSVAHTHISAKGDLTTPKSTTATNPRLERPRS